MSEIEIPRTPGSYDENVNSEIGRISFAFEPDPEYDRPEGEEPGPDSYLVDFRDGYVHFTSLDEMEHFAAQLNAFVKRHRQ